MSNSLLRSSLIRLASAHPEFRAELLPILRSAPQVVTAGAPTFAALKLEFMHSYLIDVGDALMEILRQRGCRGINVRAANRNIGVGITGLTEDNVSFSFDIHWELEESIRTVILVGDGEVVPKTKVSSLTAPQVAETLYYNHFQGLVL